MEIVAAVAFSFVVFGGTLMGSKSAVLYALGAVSVAAGAAVLGGVGVLLLFT